MKWLERLSILLVLLAFVPFAVTSMEPKYNPVITPLEITSIEKIGPSTSRIKGHATRLRGCNFIELNWYLGRRNEQSVKVKVTFEDRPKVREGKTTWEGIIVGLFPEQIISKSYANVVYECWGTGFPRTYQPFYDGDGRDIRLLYGTRPYDE